MTRKKFRPAWWAVILVLILSSVMSALGVWQLRRGFDKQELLDRYAQAAQQAPRRIDATAVAERARIERAIVQGRFDSSRQLLLDNQGWEGKPGYHVWTPLVQDDGSVVLVDRGWIARAQAQASLEVSETPRELLGYWRSLPVPGLRLESDNCAAQAWPRIVQYPTFADLQCLYGPSVAAGLLLMDADAADGYVREWKTAPELQPAKHYGYAAQWFAFTLTLLAIFVKLSFRSPTSS